ncbi:MAG: Activator of Hsp90 ATPase 1 family protein [Bryobacterales bacterium]|nr:Activator of Hsp90 ATPase 1 family protein [Bryobacterales bacterium]
MAELSTLHHSFVIERTYAAPPELVFAALADPVQKRKWFAEGSANHQTEEFTMDFRVSGTERVQSRFGDQSPFPGVALIAEGFYLDIQPDRRVVIASTMSVGDRRISASLVTFELLPAKAGTELVLTHQAAFFEGSDSPKMREDGWRKLLDRLAVSLAS